MLICNTPFLSLWQSKLPESNPSWLLGTNVTVKCNHEDVSCLSAIRANNLSGLSLNTQAQHLTTTSSKGQHWQFDTPPSITGTVKHWPIACLISPSLYSTDGISSHQLAQYLTLILGLPMPQMHTPDSICTYGAPLPYFWVPSTQLLPVGWEILKKGHDNVLKVFTLEIWLLGIGAVDLDFIMTSQPHQTSQKWGYCCHIWWTHTNH